MIKLRETEIGLRELTGDIISILPIEKGFSNEKKWRVTAKNGEFLLRSSSSDKVERKKEEYNLMVELYNKGVKCNKPISMFESPDKMTVYSLYLWLPGRDAETCIQDINPLRQYEIGVEAGRDLKKINGAASDTTTWYERKWKKHNYYLKQYKEMDYSLDEDKKILKFIEMNYDMAEYGPDLLQHDDFHLGNIVINNMEYGGVLDFNRYDWGDPLHEFVKLEWFTWTVGKDFARGQVQGYFGENGINDEECRRISVYIAMSLFSTVVWTLKFHPHTMGTIEKNIESILNHYRFFDKTIPDWAI